MLFPKALYSNQFLQPHASNFSVIVEDTVEFQPGSSLQGVDSEKRTCGTVPWPELVSHWPEASPSRDTAHRDRQKLPHEVQHSHVPFPPRGGGKGRVVSDLVRGF